MFEKERWQGKHLDLGKLKILKAPTNNNELRDLSISLSIIRLAKLSRLLGLGMYLGCTDIWSGNFPKAITLETEMKAV
jgi:hypothetical protein